MIPQSFIQDLLNRIDIVEVVGRHVHLKKAGANYSACCPFHDEKTPSFTVSPTKQFYHCFGCGAHGSAIGFVMAYSGMSYVESIRELAGQLGLAVPEEKGAHVEIQTPDLAEVMQKATKFYRESLKQSDAAISYLKKRGLSGEIASRFGIGYAPSGWRNLDRVFPDYDAQELVEAGLVISGEGKRYDRFRDRIMFPIVDMRGRIIGFGGRVLESGEPKYLNSPETPLFEKGRELYGLFQARRAIHDASRALVVEGYMDVVALAQHGIDYAVATLGTATTPIHVQKLFKHTDHIIFCFDGDNAGRRAAWRALENSLALLSDEKEISFLFLPQGEDPDSFVRSQGRETFENLLNQAPALSSFLVSELSSRVNLGSEEGRARFLFDAKPLLAQIRAPNLSLILRKRMAEVARVELAELEALFQIKPPGRSEKSPPRKSAGRRPNVVRKLIEMLMHSSSLAKLVDMGEIDLEANIPGIRGNEAQTLGKLHDFLAANPVNTAAVIEHFRGSEEGVLLQEISPGLLSIEEAGLGADEIEKEFRGAWKQLQSMLCKASMDDLLEK
ncbi:MAG TPA: DNA primase, partial [Burkholderiales bacterium]|nr:DNA primase [Burkholderiales bacterium]